MNGDGLRDVVILPAPGGPELAYYPGGGDGNFGRAPNLSPCGDSTTLNAIFLDGHGRTISSRATGLIGSTRDALTAHIDYLATGEPVMFTQSHDAGGGNETIRRWRQLDSLGRLVMNADPNTSKDFAPDPSEVGLRYFGACYYHVALGRWLSPDPLHVRCRNSHHSPTRRHASHSE
jgi:hypothetical protein